VAEDGFPHFLTGYLYDLATAFMRFYEACPILNEDEALKGSRLTLCRITAERLQLGLDLLGIRTVSRM
jgi:arginyl-tRNA synthetase